MTQLRKYNGKAAALTNHGVIPKCPRIHQRAEGSRVQRPRIIHTPIVHPPLTHLAHDR
jgi:hypothetical protein